MAFVADDGFLSVKAREAAMASRRSNESKRALSRKKTASKLRS